MSAQPRGQLTIGLVAALADGMGGRQGRPRGGGIGRAGLHRGLPGPAADPGHGAHRRARRGCRESLDSHARPLRPGSERHGLHFECTGSVRDGVPIWSMLGIRVSIACATTSSRCSPPTTRWARPGTTHALTRAVGAQDSLRVDHFKETAHLHDRYLHLQRWRARRAFAARKSMRCWRKRAAPQETARQLVEHADGQHRFGQRDRARARYSGVADDAVRGPRARHRRAAVAQRARRAATSSMTTSSARCWPMASTCGCSARAISAADARSCSSFRSRVPASMRCCAPRCCARCGSRATCAARSSPSRSNRPASGAPVCMACCPSTKARRSSSGCCAGRR